MEFILYRVVLITEPDGFGLIHFIFCPNSYWILTYLILFLPKKYWPCHFKCGKYIMLDTKYFKRRTCMRSWCNVIKIICLFRPFSALRYSPYSFQLHKSLTRNSKLKLGDIGVDGKIYDYERIKR